MADASITYSLKFQARALAAVQSDKLQSKWVVGTNALREENEVSSPYKFVYISLHPVTPCPYFHLHRFVSYSMTLTRSELFV